MRAIQQPIITNYVMTQIMIAENEKISSICVRRTRQRKRGRQMTFKFDIHGFYHNELGM